VNESPLDDELEAMRAIVLELEPLEWPTRWRVLRYLADRYAVPGNDIVAPTAENMKASMDYATSAYACGTGEAP
jgi:hypothetical protein